jgi:glycosyltransferase involved in cell wall biosynthesis
MHLVVNASDVGRQRGGNESYLVGLMAGLAALDPRPRVSLLVCNGGRSPSYPPAFGRLDVGPYRRFPFFLWQQTRALRRIKADWYLSTFFLPLSTPCRAAVLIHDLSFRAHPDYFPRIIALYMRLLTGLAIRRADLVIALSEFTRGEIARFHPGAKDKTVVVYPGIGSEFKPAADPAADARVLAGLGLERPYLLAVGNIHPRKNLARLLAAWQRLRDVGRPLPAMVWAGIGRWQSGELLDQARAAGVRLPGFVATEHLPALYRQAEALVYPSLYEGFGLPPLEAMACGTPVLVANTTSLPEAVGEASLLVDPGDEAALVAGLERVLFDGSLRRQLREQGLIRAARFRWPQTAAELLKALDGVVS